MSFEIVDIVAHDLMPVIVTAWRDVVNRRVKGMYTLTASYRRTRGRVEQKNRA